jgi:hypothetical protein
LLATFDDSRNDEALFVGWFDYFTAVGKWPIEAAVFQNWYFSLHFESADPDFPSGYEIGGRFPEWEAEQRPVRKRRLRELIDLAKQQPACMNDPRNEKEPLIFSSLQGYLPK